MKLSDIDAAFTRYRRAALPNVAILLGSLVACFALILGWRYLSIGALSDPQPGTDYFALVVLSAWGLIIAPWLCISESRGLRKHGLVCPHCGRLWRFPVRKKLLSSGACPYCHTNLAPASN